MINDIFAGKSSPSSTPVQFLEELLSTLRHQLGNSVNALKVTLDVLHENFDRFNDEKKREYLQRAKEVLARQQAMVDAMKSYSSVNANDRKPMNFASFWEQFLVILRQRTEKVTSVQSLPEGPCDVMGSPVAVQTVLSQLVENALDAVDGMENPKIELSVVCESEDLRISVTDNGCGIKLRDMSKIFVPLFTTKPKREGMGLSIALKLMVQMDGRLEIAPREEGGTAATIWLKRAGGENHGQAMQQ